MLGKTANSVYREYKLKGGTLSFMDFLHREKEKLFNANGDDDNLLLINRSLNDTVQKTIKNVTAQGGLQETESGKTIFGINKKIVIGGGVLIAGAIILLIYKKYKK